MNLEEMNAIVRAACESQQVPPTEVIINRRAKRLAGLYKWNTMTGAHRIEIAAWLLSAPEADQRETVLHEAAHHIARIRYGENCNHDARWRAIAIAVGSTGEVHYGEEVAAYAPPPRVFYTCGMGCEIKGHRKPRRRYELFVCTKHRRMFWAV